MPFKNLFYFAIVAMATGYVLRYTIIAHDYLPSITNVLALDIHYYVVFAT